MVARSNNNARFTEIGRCPVTHCDTIPWLTPPAILPISDWDFPVLSMYSDSVMGMMNSIAVYLGQ